MSRIRQAIAVLLVLISLISVVSAETIYDQTYEEVESTSISTVTPASSYNSGVGLVGMYITPSLATPDFKLMSARIPGSKVDNYGALQDSDNVKVDLYRANNDGTLIAFYGTGEFGYFKYTNEGADYLHVWIELDSDAEYSSITGDTYLRFIPQDGESITYPLLKIYNGYAESNLNTLMGVVSTDSPGSKAFFGGHNSYSHLWVSIGGNIEHQIILYGEWKNRVLVDTVDGPGSPIVNRSEITIYRSLPDGGGPSDVYISFVGGSRQDVAGTSDLHYTVPSEYYPFSIDVKSLYGNWYNATLFASAGGNARATVYVRSLDTGALIPGSQITISDATTEPMNELINETLSIGTKQFDLPKSTSLKYHASATAEGYAPIFPILFGLGDEGATITLWMTPDTPPDDPIEEGKSLLYGYALTQGSQQPISGATVALDGYGTATTTSTGFYSFVNVTPGDYSITATATTHDPLNEIVTVAAPSTQHNMALTGQHTLTIIAKDADTLANIQNATISLSDGQESTQNPATFTVDYGTYTITTAAEGYYPATQYEYIEAPGTITATVLMTVKPPDPTPAEMPNYPPHNVKFIVRSAFGGPIEGATVQATGYETTMGAWSWLLDLLGIDYEETQIHNQTMNGTTGNDGAIDFMMIEAIKYQVTIVKPGEINTTWEGYPKDEYYTIWASEFGASEWFEHGSDPLAVVNVTITETSADDTSASIDMVYNDTLAQTTSATVRLNQTFTNGTSTEITNQTYTGDSDFTHTFNLAGDRRGESYQLYVDVQHGTFGNFTRNAGVFFKPAPNSLGLPEDLLLYAAMGVMLFTCLFFGQSSVGAGCVVFALEGWVFFWLGWLRDLGSEYAVGTVLIIISFVAFLVNVMHRSKRERFA